MSTHAILTPINYGLQSASTWTSGSAATNLPVTGLGDIWLWPPWQGSSGSATRPRQGMEMHNTEVSLDLGSARTVGGFGFVEGNTSSERQHRLRLGTSVAPPARERVAVNSGAPGSAGWDDTNAWAKMDDDPTAASSDKATTTSDAEQYQWVLTATPSADPITGTDLQICRVLFKGAAADDATFVKIVVRDGAANVQTVTVSKTITAGDFILFHIPWDAANLATADGSGVAFRVYCSGGTSGTGDVELHAIDWFALTGAATYEGEWGEVYPAAMLGDSLGGNHLADESDLPGNWADHYASGGTYQGLSARYAVVETLDDQNSDGYIQIGGAYVGPSIYLEDVITHGWGSGASWDKEIDRAVRSLSLNARLASDTLTSDLKVWLSTPNRQRLAMFQLFPDRGDSLRTISEHFPMLVRADGAVGSQQVAGRGTLTTASEHDVSLNLTEWRGQRLR